MSCESWIANLKEFWGGAPQGQGPRAYVTMVVQHSSTGEVEYVTGPLSSDDGQKFYCTQMYVLDSNVRFVEAQNHQWQISFESSNNGVSFSFGASLQYNFTGDCSQHSGFVVARAVNGPNQGDAMVLLSLDHKEYAPIVNPIH